MLAYLQGEVAMNRKMVCFLIFAAAMFSGTCSGAFARQANVTQVAGGRGGSPFADSLPAQGARIAEVRVRAGDTADAVQVIYTLLDGRISEGARHGGRGGRENVFHLDNDEYITGISGRYGDAIDSLRIHTNKRTSPLYGGGGGNQDFQVEVPLGNQAMGFAGRAGDTLDSVGLIYVTAQRRNTRWDRFRPSPRNRN
jgi:hypothetical protein